MQGVLQGFRVVGSGSKLGRDYPVVAYRFGGAVELDGVKLDTNDLRLEAGTYYLSGIVTDQPAALRITVKDMAYENATTAEELYNAMQKNRTVSKTYYFNAAQPAEQPIAKNPVVIPKTGDISIIAFAVPLSLIGFGLFVAGKRR